MSTLTANGAPRGLTWRFALREMRGGLRGFAVFISCIALGVAAIAGVGSFARSLGDGLAREGRIILGGDASFSLMAREASAPERKFLDDNGRVSVAATMRAMARAADGQTALVELKAVDGAYPLYGDVALDPASRLADALAERDGAFGAAVDPALLARLNIERGARVTLGAATIELRAILKGEPDKLAGGIGFGPRLLISEAALRATGLIQPGSLVRWHYRLRLPAADPNDRAANAVIAASEKQLPDAGWEVRTRANASPALGRNIERFTQYLTLVGLTALLVGGVGVANAVKHYLDRRRNTIATLKSLGATGGRIFAIYLTEVMLLAAVGIAIGLVDRRDPAVCDLGGARQCPAAADRARAARGRALIRGALRLSHRARLRALAARPRPRRAGLSPLPRHGRAGAPHSAQALCGTHRPGRRCAGGASPSCSPMIARSRRSSLPLRRAYS